MSCMYDNMSYILRENINKEYTTEYRAVKLCEHLILMHYLCKYVELVIVFYYFAILYNREKLKQQYQFLD